MVTAKEFIQNLSNDDLINLFVKKVRTDHYDPFETPDDMVNLTNMRIDQDDLKNEIFKRMKI